MTLLDFTRKLCRWLTIQDPAVASIETAQELIDAVNAALVEFYLFGPSLYRRRNFSFNLLPGYTRTLSLSAGSFSVGSYSPEDVFRACQIPGDSLANRIMPGGMLRHPYPGSDGYQTSTLYGDAIALPMNFHAAQQNPLVLGAWPACSLSLQNCTAKQFLIDRPLHWWVESLAQDEGLGQGQPRAFLRVWPAPNQLYSCEMEIEVRPVQYTIADLTTAALPLEDELATLILEPLALGHLLPTALWQNAAMQKIVQDRVDRARAALDTLPKNLSTPRLRFAPGLTSPW